MEPFVGRADQLARLHQLAADVADTGIGRFVLVTGEAGAGKTRLCREFERQLPDVASAFCRCWDGGGGPAFWPWPDVVAELGRSCGGRLDLMSPSEVPDRFALFQTLVDRLRAVTAAGPSLAVVDDLHVAHEDVLLLTRFVVRSLHRFPLLVVATWRHEPTAGGQALRDPDELGHLDALVRDATLMHLGPLGAAEVAGFVRQVHRREASPVEVTDLLAATGGSPMFLAELVADPALDEAARADGLARVLARRVAAIGEVARRVLGVAALLGTGATVDEVAETAQLPVADVIDAVSGAGSRLGATLTGSRIQFSHDLLRDAYAAALPTARRRELHAAAVAAIRGSSTEQIGRRGRHAVEAAGLSAEHASRAVAACAETAAALHRDLAFEQAARQAATGWRLAVETAAPAAAEAELRIAHAHAVLAGGHLGAARELYGRSVEPVARAGDPRLLAATALGLGGVWVEEQRDELARRRMLELCRRALAELGAGDPVLSALLRVRLAAEHAYDRVPGADVAAAVDAVRALADPAATAQALSLYHHTLLAPDTADLRMRVADELIDSAARAGSTIYSLFGLCWRTVDLYLVGDPRAERSFTELREQATAVGSRSIEYIVAVQEVMRTFRRGDLVAAEALAGQALTLGLEVGDADATGYHGAHLLGIRWAQGRLGEMYDAGAAVVESATLRRHDRSYAAVLAYAAALRGDHAAARTQLDAVLADDPDSIMEFSSGGATFAVLVEAAAELGDGDLATELGIRFEPYARLPVVPSLAVMCLGPGERTVAVAHATAGRLDEAIDWFRAARRANRRLGNRPFEAVIDAQLAAALHRRGRPDDRDEAARLLAEAVTVGTACGLAARVSRWQADATARRADRPAPAVRAIPHQHGSLEQLRRGWRVGIDGRSVTVEHAVGMRYLAELIVRPDTDIPAGVLSAAVTRAEPDASPGAPMLDPRALADYRRRIARLDRELDEADRVGDQVRARRAADERSWLVDRLRRDTGLCGRSRRFSDDAERCRMRVSKAIRRAISRVGGADPVLGRALESRIRTGYVCRYVSDPGHPIDWTVHRAVPTVSHRDTEVSRSHG